MTLVLAKQRLSERPRQTLDFETLPGIQVAIR